MIWCFGDSNTEGYNLDYQWVKDYTTYKGYIPKWWTEVLSKKLNQPITNRGKGGTDNYTILDSIIKEVDNIRPKDTLIINWSSVLRSRAVLNNELISLHIGGFPDIPNFDNESIQQMLVNRDSERFVEEVMGWNKLLEYAFRENKIIFWSSFPEFRGRVAIDNTTLHPPFAVYSINDETRGAIADGHPSETGCELLASLLYNYLTPKRSFI